MLAHRGRGMHLRASSLAPLSSSAGADSELDDGLVFLPRAAPLVEALCVAVYVALALVAGARALSGFATTTRTINTATPTTPARPRRADELKRKQSFQRLMVMFALTRAASFLARGETRDLLNRAALCFFFSLVLFQVLFWIDIANPKHSKRSRRIWNAFLGVNALFYAVVFGLTALAARSSGSKPSADLMGRTRDWDLAPVLLIALGSFTSALGLLYSTCKTRRRVGRVLKQFAERSAPNSRTASRQVEFKLHRALRVTNAIMGICAVLLVVRTVLYMQRPFSHRECGAIRDPNACILVGYGLPEVVPCVLFLVLMWEVEPNLKLSSRRKSSVNVVAVARASESTPLLLRDRGRDIELVIDTVESAGIGHHPLRRSRQRPSPLSSALGGNVIAKARRRLKRVLEESFGIRTDDDESSSAALASESSPSQFSSSRDDPTPSPGALPIGLQGIDNAVAHTGVWMSFHCVSLNLPSLGSSAVFLALNREDAGTSDMVEELGRTEVVYSAAPVFRVMIPVDLQEAGALRAAVYAVTNPASIQDLSSQWLIGDTLLPVAAYCFPQKLPPAAGKNVVRAGSASVHQLFSPLSKTHSSGELVVRCEADLMTVDSGADATRLQRITRGFVFVPTKHQLGHTGRSGAFGALDLMPSSPTKLLVEEELIESVYTWEMPYQLLQLILSDLLVQLDVMKQAMVEEPNELHADAKMGEDDSAVPKTRTKATPSVGMLSEMIMQIQDDAMERKNKKWTVELVAKMEKYVNDVEAAILRYEAANHGGLTFKPSTMKADSGLSFLALNLHQQLLTVGNAAAPLFSDVRSSAGGVGVAERYVRLARLSTSDSMSSPPPRSTSGTENAVFHVQIDERDIVGQTLQPREALRRRMISFDSAEHIVQSYASGDTLVCLSREQRLLAESIVALGEYHAQQSECDVEAEEEPESTDSLLPRTVGIGGQSGSMEFDGEVDRMLREVDSAQTSAKARVSRHREPFAERGLHGTTTVGAFAAHVYGFRKGGVRQMRRELQRLTQRMVQESERPRSDLTVEALEREVVELQWLINRRLEVTACQAMSALATCFQQTLYVSLYGHSAHHASGATPAVAFSYLDMMSEIGFVFSVESLLSTYSNEAGMLGDMEAAVRELERVRIRLRPVQSPRAAQFRVSVTTGLDGLMMELPLIVCAPDEHLTRSMHRIPGQDAATGAVYLALVSDEDWARARLIFRRTIAVVPILFSQGLNEMQTVANTVGRDVLQKEINAENLVVLERQVDVYTRWRAVHSVEEARPPGIVCADISPSASIVGNEVADDVTRRLARMLPQLRELVHSSRRGKRMDILTLSSGIVRLMGGGRVTCCKSAKDRTAMSVTLEEATLLVQCHGLREGERDAVTALLRTHGVRRENARKNIGRAQYCFSALQNFMLPSDYQCPPGTGGGSRALT